TVTGLGNCHWINSILQKNNSEYFEGMDVAQRLILDQVPATSGNVHTLTFHMQWSHSGIHAYDWLTGWDDVSATSQAIGGFPTTRNPCGQEIDNSLIPPPPPGVCQGLQAGSSAQVNVPDDPFLSGIGGNGTSTQSRINAYETAYGDRNITLL